MPIEQIAKMTHHTYKTIQNYLNPDYSVVDGHYNVRIPNKLAPFEKDVIELRSKGMTYVIIHEEMVQRKALFQLSYKKIEDVFIINPDQYKKGTRNLSYAGKFVCRNQRIL